MLNKALLRLSKPGNAALGCDPASTLNRLYADYNKSVQNDRSGCEILLREPPSQLVPPAHA